MHRLWFALALLCGCSVPDVKVGAAWYRSNLSGQVALESVSGGTEPVDVERDLGLGNDLDSVQLEVEVDPGFGRIRAQGLTLQDTGTGRLSEAFGVIASGTIVESSLDAVSLRGLWTFDVVPTDTVRVAPGIGLQFFQADTEVRSVTPISVVESVDVTAVVPMPVLEVEVHLDDFALELDGGGISVNAGDAGGAWWEAGARIRYTPSDWSEVFVGYRAIHIDARGDASDERFDSEFDLTGWLIGARFCF